MPHFPRLVFVLFAVYQICNCTATQAKTGILFCDQGFLLEETTACPGGEANLSSYGLNDQPRCISKLFRFKAGKNKKLIAALLAFPFPFGIVGLHRIYLGTSPHVPLVYIGTLGGGFGLIPLIDFFAILFEKDINHYINNNKVFMWIN